MENTKKPWLPANAKEPKSKSNYTMPLPEGATKIRVMSSAIVGYESWANDGEKKTPTRHEIGEEPAFGGDGKSPNYFWAFIVYNYNTEQLQIMEVTQKTIRTAMQSKIDNEAWGDPKTYDIVITRTGMKLDDTEYDVTPNPHTDLDPAIEQLYTDNPIDLQEWFKGEDPFKKEE